MVTVTNKPACATCLTLSVSPSETTGAGEFHKPTGVGELTDRKVDRYWMRLIFKRRYY